MHLAGSNLSSLFDTYSTIEIACEDFNVSFILHGRRGLKQRNVRLMCVYESSEAQGVEILEIRPFPCQVQTKRSKRTLIRITYSILKL